MNEKTMVADALTGVNGELKMFGDMIPQTENKELKQCLKQIRSQCEMSQEKLYQIAREKSYYVPAEKATREEVNSFSKLITAKWCDPTFQITPFFIYRFFFYSFFLLQLSFSAAFISGFFFFFLCFS